MPGERVQEESVVSKTSITFGWIDHYYVTRVPRTQGRRLSFYGFFGSIPAGDSKILVTTHGKS